jgi:hypothetical protein
MPFHICGDEIRLFFAFIPETVIAIRLWQMKRRMRVQK